MKRLIKYTAAAAIATMALMACKKDFDYVVPKPKVLFTQGSSRSAVPAAAIKVRYALQSASGAASLKITQSVNNGAATNVTEVTSFTDPIASSGELNYTVPASVVNGDRLRLIFQLSDKNGLMSDTAVYTINVVGALYQEVAQTINGQAVTTLLPPTGQTVTTINLNDYTFQTGKKYVITGLTQVEEGLRVIFEPGTEVYAVAGLVPSTVFRVPPTATIQANGTKTQPILFTSLAALNGGTPRPGDWQGLQVIGNANTTATDNSGTLRYVRVEFGGRDNGDNGQTGAIVFNNVGRGTTAEYLQSFKGNGNGIRINGGTVNLRYCVATDNGDNGFRCDDFTTLTGAITAWNGNGQFWISVNNITQFLNFTAGSGTGTLTNRDAPELEIRDGANPALSNITLIGRSGAPGTAPEDGIRIRNTAGGYRLFHLILTQIPDDGVRAELAAPSADLTGTRTIGHSHFFSIRDQALRDNATVFNQPVYNNSFTAIAGIGINDFVPDAETVTTYNPQTLNSWFTAARYVGAIRDGAAANDWTADGNWCKNSDGTIR
jgi:hypothetical protein